MFDRHVGEHNGLAVWRRDTGFAGTIDQLRGGDTALSVWFLRDKIAANSGFAVRIHSLREYTQFCV